MESAHSRSGGDLIVTRCRRACLVFVMAVLAIAGTPGAGRAFAQTADDLFDDRTLHELRLFLHPRDLEALRAHYDANIYYPVDVVWRGVRVTTAGVRVRGLASRTATKPALLLDFDRYIRGQSFLGFTELALDNLVTDPSAIREALSMALFNRIGQSAPRESFTRLYINDVYHGVYGVVEAVNPHFLAKGGLNADGYLFEKVYAGQFHGENRSLAAYTDLFEARTREHESDSVLYGPIRELFEEVNEKVDNVWSDHVSHYLELEQFMTYVAVETFLSEKDGVLGFAGMANFYLYRPAGGPHRLIPWDKDSSFDRIDSPILLRADENELFRRAITLDALRARYLDALEQCARTAALDGWLEDEIARLAAVVSEAVHDDPVKPYTNAQHDAAVAYLIQFARERPPFVLGAVGAARAGR
jgi:spore coat protein CotH